MKRIILLFGFFIGLVNMQGQIVNTGILKIETGTTVYFGNDYTNSGTHTNEGDLYLEGDFTNDGTTSVPTSGTTFFNSTTNATQTIDGSSNEIHFYNLTVNNTATSVQGLEVVDQYDLEVENILALTSGKLRLMGEAQLIQTHTGASNNTGVEHLLKDQDGAENAYRYNYWSSPVQNDTGTVFNLSTVLKDGTSPNQWTPTQVGFTTALNGNQNTPIELSTRWLWKYTDGNINPWNDIGWTSLFNLGTTTPSTGADMNPGEGFCMKGTHATNIGQQNYSFEGIPNNGTYTLSIDDEGEYLIGNPYPSALDPVQFINDNSSSIDGTIWFLDHWSTDTHVYHDYGAGYIVYSPGSGSTNASLHPHYVGGLHNGESGTTTLDGLYKIPVGQGFVVRRTATSGGPATITFQNSQRVFAITNSVKSSSTIPRIRLGYEGPDQRHRYTLLAFTENGTDSFDYGFEAEMIDVAPNDMYYIIEDGGNGLPYVIQGVGEFNIDAEYKLKIKAGTSGYHHIMIDKLESFDEPIYILDETSETHNLRDWGYVVYIPDNQSSKELSLVFKPHSTTNIQDYLHDFVSAFYANDEIIIRNNKEVPLSSLQVYNSLGQLVYQITDAGRLTGEEIHIPFTNYAQTAYVLKLQAEMGNGTYKFINY